MKRFLVALLLLAGMGAIVIYTLGSGETPESRFSWSGAGGGGVTIATAEMALMAVNVSASGIVTPADEAFVISPLSEKITEVRFKEGDHVKQGDVLFVLDRSRIQRRIDIASAQLRVAQAQLEEARVGKDGVLRAIEEARKPYVPRIEQAEAGIAIKSAFVKEREAEVARAEKDFKWKKELWSQGRVAGVDYIAAEAAYKRAVAALEAAQNDLESARKTRDSLVAELEEHLATLKRDVRAIEAREAVARERISEMELARAQAQAEEANTMVTAPIAGTLLHVRARVGDVPPAGYVATRENALIVIADVSRLFVEAEVDERDVFNIMLKQPATIRLDAVPGKEYKGCVARIAGMASRAARNPDMPVFKIWIEIEGAGSELRPGLSARVDIVTAQRERALQVPIACVVERRLDELGLPETQQVADPTATRPGYAKVAFVLTGGRVEARRVRLGFATEAKVEVLSGLKEGEEVIAGPYRLLMRLKHGDELRAK